MNIKLTEDQKKRLNDISFGELAESPNLIPTTLTRKLDYLYTHNKNYTKAQEYTIDDIRNIINILFDGKEKN